jgi:hypothetical protein
MDTEPPLVVFGHVDQGVLHPVQMRSRLSAWVRHMWASRVRMLSCLA